MDTPLFGPLYTQLEQAKALVESWETTAKNHEAMLDLAKRNIEALNDKITFNVGGTLLLTTKETLLRVKDSYFTSMMASGHWKPQADGTFFIDRNPICFGRILDYLRYEVLDMDGLTPALKMMLQMDFDYFFPNAKAPGMLGLQNDYLIAIYEWLDKPIDTSKLLWRGSRDGFTAKAFHSRCDNKGATLTLIKSAEGWLFGAYNPIDWQSIEGGYYFKASGAFLFTLKNPHDIPPTRYNCTNQSKAIINNAKSGPIFGECDLVAFGHQTNRKCYTNFPARYEDTTGFGNTTFTGAKEFVVAEIEVFAVS